MLVGTIPRKVLCILIKHKAFAPLEVLSLAHKTASPGNNSDINHEGTTLNLRELLARKDVDDNIRNMSPIVNWGTLECVYPDYPDISSLSISESERSALLDLRPYMDCAPFALSSLASIQRAYRMFRTLGLRHLCVINMSNQVVGMLTRKNLTPEHLMGKSSHHTITRQKPRRKNSDYLQPTIELNVHEL